MFDDTCFKQIRKCEVQGRESPHGRGGRACLRGGGGGLCRCPANRAGRAVGRLCRGLSVLEGRVRLCRRGPPAHSPARSPTRPFAHSPVRPLARSPTRPPVRLPARPLARSLARSPTRPPLQYSRPCGTALAAGSTVRCPSAPRRRRAPSFFLQNAKN